MNFEFLDHDADIAARISGHDLAELAEAGFNAYSSALFEGKGGKGIKKKIIIHSPSPEEMLVDFLNELNFLFSSEHLLPAETDIELINLTMGKYRLKADVKFEKYNEKFHELHEEIKAVTYHQLEIIEKDGRLETIIVFDI